MSKKELIDDFCQILNKRVEKKSIGQCARYVREAYEMATKTQINKVLSAKLYIDSYLSTGNFTKLDLQDIDNYINQDKQKGDIAIFTDGEHGHICAFDGNQWISDFKQRDIYGGGQRRKNKVQPIILRWK